MNGPLRSLSGLVDFDCAARWGSFRLAAHELHKTPAAVSQQIKQLEAALGFPLFIRHPRQVRLTEKGQDLAASVAALLADLQKKVSALQGNDEEKILRISTTQSVAIKWLVPRIGKFTKQFPDIEIRIDSNDSLVNVDDDNVDVAIRFGAVDSADPALVFRERMVVVYSPSLLVPGQDALTLSDLTRFPLLHSHTTEAWVNLLRANRILKGDYHFSRGYSNTAVRTQAAVAGQGIALVAYSVACQDIQNGSLRMLDCRSPPYNKGYRFLVNRRKQGLPKIERFRVWLTAEMNEMRGELDDFLTSRATAMR
jgi:LysR family glycine cleavage system transcriptional activator